MVLLGVFYSEFDNVAGPKICFQAPKDFFPADKFDGVSDYIIVGMPLSHKLISVDAFGYKIVGHPMCIADEKYDRNALLFNVAFVFPGEASAEEVEPYHPALRKIAVTLSSIEQESQFLFDPKKKERLGDILPQVLAGLTMRGECAIVLNDANMLNLKLFWNPGTPRHVGDQEVPVLLQDPEVLMSLDCDLALQQVVPHIDGVKYAKKISQVAEVDIEVVKRCLRALLYYGCITLVPIFQYQDTYQATARTAVFAADVGLQRQCLEFVRRREWPPPPLWALVRLYCGFRPELCVRDLLLRHRDVIDLVHHSRLVTFGVVHGLIRRVHRYPVCLKAPAGAQRRPQAGAAPVQMGYGTLAPRQTTMNPMLPLPLPLPPARAQTVPVPQGQPPSPPQGPAPPATVQQQQLEQQEQPHGAAGVAPALSAAAAGNRAAMPAIQALMDGTVTANELCCRFMLPWEQLEALAKSDGSAVVSIHK